MISIVIKRNVSLLESVQLQTISNKNSAVFKASTENDICRKISLEILSDVTLSPEGPDQVPVDNKEV